jgi:hypothetical protein
MGSVVDFPSGGLIELAIGEVEGSTIAIYYGITLELRSKLGTQFMPRITSDLGGELLKLAQSIPSFAEQMSEHTDDHARLAELLRQLFIAALRSVA